MEQENGRRPVLWCGAVMSGDWLWEAGTSRGVAVGEGGAQRAADAAGGCGTATARVEAGRRTLDAELQRSWALTGQGWTGERGADGEMRWTPFGVLAEAS